MIDEFLAVIWGNGPHSICWMDPERAFTFAIVPDPAAITRHLGDLQGVDVWIGAHPLKGTPARGRGDRDDVAEVVAIPADLDWAHPTRRSDDPLPTEEEVRTGLARLGVDLQPSIVVHSGHGLQPWWRLAYPVSPEEAEELIDRLGVALAKVGLVNGRADLPSILRLPGTANHKDPDDVVAVTIESFTDRRFTPPYLRKHLPEASGGTGRKGGTRHRGGSLTPDQQDLTNLLLTRYRGHSVDVWRDGSVHLVRPGKSAREGTSASIITGEDGDALLTVFSDHWPDLPPGSYVRAADGSLTHPSNVMATITVNVPQQNVVVDYQAKPSIFIDWLEFAKRDTSQHRWLVESFWPWGRGMALWASAKEGKSELVLWCAGNLAMGRHPWTGDPIEPIHVAYFDYEMTEDDLEERLSDFGFDPADLDNLHYSLFPPLHALDVQLGGEELTGHVESVGAQAVILDTFSRAVAGDENEASTVQDFYRYTGIRLKQMGIGYLRLDHAGHDASKGHPRGTSAKRDDIDVMWRQQRTQSGVTLNCTGGSRLSWVGPILSIDRSVNQTGEVTYSSPIRMGWSSGVAEKAKELDDIKAPVDLTKRDAIDRLKAAGLKPGRITVLLEAIKFRKTPRPHSGTTSGTTFGNDPDEPDGNQDQDDPPDLFSDQDL